ncbi:MAG: phenylalanine 4-monooxygenase [Rickettsiales bacterium]|nr:phenylalanine 4-monooxygenase [Rickettsiales bacterium]
MGTEEYVYEYPDYPQMKADFSIPDQYYERYTPEDQDVWRFLYKRQMELMPKYACQTYLDALEDMPITGDEIPHFDAINEKLYAATGWELVPVPGLIPAHSFFTHLATKAFPVTHWMRPKDRIDYLQEPDLFHDLFGHVPLLMNPIFGQYLSAFGRGGCRALRIGDEKSLENLTRLYWYTVEFGLMREANQTKIYGAGILSSPGEVVFSIDSPSPNRIAFDMKRMMQTDFIISDYQESYWVIDHFEQLFEATKPDFKKIYQELAPQPVYRPEQTLEKDKIYTTGTGEYHRAKAS